MRADRGNEIVAEVRRRPRRRWAKVGGAFAAVAAIGLLASSCTGPLKAQKTTLALSCVRSEMVLPVPGDQRSTWPVNLRSGKASTVTAAGWPTRMLVIWVSLYKKTAGISTDLTEDVIRNWALKHGLVDVKVCAVSDSWSGLKLVVPLSKR